VNARPVASVADVRKVGAASIQQLSINFEKWLSEGSSKMDQKRNMTHVALLRLNQIDRYSAALPGEETIILARSVGRHGPMKRLWRAMTELESLLRLTVKDRRDV
jgi:hypothetical protein